MLSVNIFGCGGWPLVTPPPFHNTVLLTGKAYGDKPFPAYSLV